MAVGMETVFNQSTEISTIIMWANQSSLDAMLAAPTTTTIKQVETYNLTYISSSETHFFEGVGFQNSGKSTKDFAKQSYKFSFNQFQNKTTDTRKYRFYLYFEFAFFVPHVYASVNYYLLIMFLINSLGT
jgi:N-acetylglutamate synthase-like GNAT family acetyltransferase